MLWYRNALGRAGTPEYAHLHTLRQRHAMLRSMCQVCGRSARTSRGISWLLIAYEWRLLSTATEGSFVPTGNPPTCLQCRPLAMRLCPALRTQGAVAFTAAHARPVGVTADVLPSRGSGPPVTEVVLFTEPEWLARTLAKQLLVELIDIAEEQHLPG